jgi:hypothetical protein
MVTAAHSLKNHGSRKVRHGSRKLGPVKNLPKVISLQIAKPARVRHGVHLYASVQSRSRGTRIIHLVTGTKIARKVRLHCSCEAKSFNPHAVCIHQKAVSKKLAQRRAS